MDPGGSAAAGSSWLYNLWASDVYSELAEGMDIPLFGSAYAAARENPL